MEKYKVEYLQTDESEPLYLYNDLKNLDETGSTWKKKASAEKIAKSFETKLQKAKKEYYSVKVISDSEQDTSKAEKKETERSEASAEDAGEEAPIILDIENLQAALEAEKEDVPATADTSTAKPLQKPQLNPEEMISSEEITATLKAWASIVENLSAYRKKYFDILHEEDMRQQDILHYIELNSVNAAKASRLVRMLKESRIRRREAKNMLELLSNLTPVQAAGSRTSASLERIEDRKYTPRIEKDLFTGK